MAVTETQGVHQAQLARNDGQRKPKGVLNVKLRFQICTKTPCESADLRWQQHVSENTCFSRDL